MKKSNYPTSIFIHTILTKAKVNLGSYHQNIEKEYYCKYYLCDHKLGFHVLSIRDCLSKKRQPLHKY